jgi:hypothetical protein
VFLSPSGTREGLLIPTPSQKGTRQGKPERYRLRKAIYHAALLSHILQILVALKIPGSSLSVASSSPFLPVTDLWLALIENGLIRTDAQPDHDQHAPAPPPGRSSACSAGHYPWRIAPSHRLIHPDRPGLSLWHLDSSGLPSFPPAPDLPRLSIQNTERNIHHTRCDVCLRYC